MNTKVLFNILFGYYSYGMQTRRPYVIFIRAGFGCYN